MKNNTVLKPESKTKSSEKVQEESKEKSVEYDELGFRIMTDDELAKLPIPK